MGKIQVNFIGSSSYCASNPIANVELDGARFEFASGVEQKLFNSYYKSADKETKAKLDRLANSDIVYYIVTLSEKTMEGNDGKTFYNAVASKIHGESYVNVEISETAKSQVAVLGDELETAFQFQNGDIGFTATLTENAYKHKIGTLGYDLDDEAATKDASIKAFESCTENCGELTNTLQAYKQAKANNTVQEYFETDPSAKQYLNVVDRRAKTLGVSIPGNGGYKKEALQKAANAGAFDGAFYMENDQLQSVVRVE